MLLGSGLVLKLVASNYKAFIATQGATVLAADSLPIVPAPKINKVELDRAMQGLLAEYSNVSISVTYKDLTTGRTFHYGSDDTMVAASVPKVLTAAYYLKQVDEGKRSLSDSVGGASARQQLRNLIVVSDNAAWVALDRALGAKNLESFAKDTGLKNYRHSTNSLTSDDMVTLLQKIYRGNLLSRENTDLLLSYMADANYTQYIVAAVPDDSKTYHKVGFLEDRVLDVAIVDNGRFPYLLAIFTEAKGGTFNFIEVTNFIHAATEIIHKPYEIR